METLDSLHAIDFSGMLHKTWILLRDFAECLVHLQNRFHFILVDEMQDTNRIQYDLVRRICSHGNLFVVGDYQQSVYKFRGARPENIDQMRKDFPDTVEITLPRNYRSTTQILAAAQTLIRNNETGRDVTIHSQRGDGRDISIRQYFSEDQEAAGIAHCIKSHVNNTKISWNDCAVLYRVGSFSRAIELEFRSANIPYRMVGGFSFFDRSEVKTVLSYLSVLSNPNDTIAFARAITNPKRAIGPTLIGKLERIAQQTGKSIIEVSKSADLTCSKTARLNLEEFVDLIERHSKKIQSGDDYGDVCSKLIHASGYYDYMKKESERDPDHQNRLDNIDEMLAGVISFSSDNPTTRLSDYLQSLQIVTVKHQQKDENDAVTVLTMHAAKGREWSNVYVIGAEQSYLPHFLAVAEGSIEEERRLLYVAMTRAKDYLSISHCQTRRNRKAYPSMFLDEIGYAHYKAQH